MSGVMSIAHSGSISRGNFSLLPGKGREYSSRIKDFNRFRFPTYTDLQKYCPRCGKGAFFFVE